MSRKGTSHGNVQSNRIGGFRPIGAARPKELFRARPHDDGRYLEFVAPDGYSCFVRAGAVRDMAAWGRAAGRSEVMGRLGGRQCRDRDGPYTVVEQATLGERARGGPGYIVADVAAQQALHNEFEKECRVLDSLGWWHTHVGEVGLFYSAVDRENQATWTDLDSVGIVLNPQLEGEALKVFRGPKSEPLDRASDEAILKLMRPKESSRQTATETSTSGRKQLAPKAGYSRRHRVSRAIDLRFGEVAAVSIAVAALLVAVKAFNAAFPPPQAPIPSAVAPVELSTEPGATPPAPSAIQDKEQCERAEPALPLPDLQPPEDAVSRQPQAAPADQDVPDDETDVSGPPLDEEAPQVPDRPADSEATVPGIAPREESR